MQSIKIIEKFLILTIRLKMRRDRQASVEVRHSTPVVCDAEFQIFLKTDDEQAEVSAFNVLR